MFNLQSQNSMCQNGCLREGKILQGTNQKIKALPSTMLIEQQTRLTIEETQNYIEFLGENKKTINMPNVKSQREWGKGFLP